MQCGAEARYGRQRRELKSPGRCDGRRCRPCTPHIGNICRLQSEALASAAIGKIAGKNVCRPDCYTGSLGIQRRKIYIQVELQPIPPRPKKAVLLWNGRCALRSHRKVSLFPCCLERPSCLASSALTVEVLLLPALESRRMSTKLGKCCDLFDGHLDGVLNLRISHTCE